MCTHVSVYGFVPVLQNLYHIICAYNECFVRVKYKFPLLKKKKKHIIKASQVLFLLLKCRVILKSENV